MVTTDLTSDGATASDLIRAAKACGASVIVISGSLTDEKDQEVRRLGADYCIQKPFDVDAVQAAVAKSISRPSS